MDYLIICFFISVPFISFFLTWIISKLPFKEFVLDFLRGIYDE